MSAHSPNLLIAKGFAQNLLAQQLLHHRLARKIFTNLAAVRMVEHLARAIDQIGDAVPPKTQPHNVAVKGADAGGAQLKHADEDPGQRFLIAKDRRGDRGDCATAGTIGKGI